MAGVRHLTVSSSGAAYGYHADNPEWIDEADPLRAGEAFAYAHHKRLVEEMLARYRKTNPQLAQLVLRISTVLGATTRNQITALFERKRILAVRGSDSPFTFVWDEDVVGAMLHGVTHDIAGVFNLTGDGKLTIHEIAWILGKPMLTLPALPMRTRSVPAVLAARVSAAGLHQPVSVSPANEKVGAPFVPLPVVMRVPPVTVETSPALEKLKMFVPPAATPMVSFDEAS